MEKMEQIGKAVLDYRFYPEDDKYTDGAIEDEMLEIARNCAPEQYERVIVEKKSWPILYHFSYLRRISSAGCRWTEVKMYWRSEQDRVRSPELFVKRGGR